MEHVVTPEFVLRGREDSLNVGQLASQAEGHKHNEEEDGPENRDGHLVKGLRVYHKDQAGTFSREA